VEWSTPRDFLAGLEAEFGAFDLDPCATPDNAVCPRYFTQEQDGLAQRWQARRVFVNPPWGGAISLWLAKAAESVARGDAELVVVLVPARTGSRWWHDWAMQGEVRFLRGRLCFGGARTSAPFDCALILFRGGEVCDTDPVTNLGP
jgi:phage N-6-adenine-methyltransferase